MKRWNLLILMWVTCGSVWAVSPVTLQLGWPDGSISAPSGQKMAVYPEGLDLEVIYWGEAPTQLKMNTVGADFLSQMTSSHYAIIGKFQCSKIAPGSYLEMLSYFAAENPGAPNKIYFSRYSIKEGSAVKTSGDDGWQSFILPFDASTAKTHLERIVMNLHFAGGYGSEINFDQVYLMQYPDGNFPPTLSLSVTTPSPQSAFQTTELQEKNPLAAIANESKKTTDIEWKSFFLGVAITGLLLLGTGSLIFLLWRWKQQQHVRELRRIASLDG